MQGSSEESFRWCAPLSRGRKHTPIWACACTGGEDAHRSVGTRAGWSGRLGVGRPVGGAGGSSELGGGCEGAGVSLMERPDREVWAGCSGSLGPFLLAGSCFGLECLRQ